MSFITDKFQTTSLNRATTYEMYIPDCGDKKTMKTLFLLHGYTGSSENWVPNYISDKYDLAVVCPNGENSFWLDGISTGHKFATLLGEELPDHINRLFGLANSAEDTYIMGLSMGGFGALHTALAYPGRFGKCAALSSAFIHNEVAGMKEGHGNDVANYEYFRECFGEPSKLKESVNNPEYLMDRLLAEGKKLPDIYMACGTEDFLLENNRAMDKFMTDRGIKHEYTESKGIHDMVFWNEYAVKAIDWMFS